MNCDNKSENATVNRTTNSPLFTGDYRRDTAVSELEKAAEASLAIFEHIKAKRKKRT